MVRRNRDSRNVNCKRTPHNRKALYTLENLGLLKKAASFKF